MNIEDYVVAEVVDTLYQANTTLLGITGLDSQEEIEKKCKENSTAINRRIQRAIILLTEKDE